MAIGEREVALTIQDSWGLSLAGRVRERRVTKRDLVRIKGMRGGT